jgi:hypothetical protein
VTWILISYRIPREPSTPRIAIWRRLRRLGALHIGDGVAAVPHGDAAREQIDWIAADIEEAGGEAIVWLATPSTKAEQRHLERRRRERLAEVEKAKQ